MKKPLLGDIAVLTVVIALLHYFSIKLAWYWQFPWLDMVSHFLGGAWVAGMLLWFVFVSGRVSTAKIQNEKLVAFLIAVFGALVVGLAWEAFEYFADVLLIQDGFLGDTLSDLVLDVIGGVAAYYYVLRKKYLG